MPPFSVIGAGEDKDSKPLTLLFDMDGVLADVSQSYRQAIVKTAAYFGVQISLDDVAEAKRCGNCNNDWELTHRFITDSGLAEAPSLDDVIERFQVRLLCVCFRQL